MLNNVKLLNRMLWGVNILLGAGIVVFSFMFLLRESDAKAYMKDFRPMNLGVFELQAGRGPLTLRALTTSSAKVMDVRSVVLTLQE